MGKKKMAKKVISGKTLAIVVYIRSFLQRTYAFGAILMKI